MGEMKYQEKIEQVERKGEIKKNKVGNGDIKDNERSYEENRAKHTKDKI